MPPRVVVIGAGPIGLAAALGAIVRGYDTTVLEAGEAGDALLRWGATRFFTPLSMNISREMRDVLGADMPPDDSLLTGPEFAHSILREIVRRDPLRGRVKEHHRVLAVGRRGMTRSDYASHPLRAERPFRLLVDTPDGEEVIEAEIVLDASGGYHVPRPFGAGGVPARGETRMNGRAIRTLGALHDARSDLRGKRVLLIGNGHSAANAIGFLEGDGVEVTWAVRSANRRPCEDVANDPLPERQRVVRHANDLAESPPPFLTIERKAMVERIEHNGVITVSFTGGRSGTYDAIAAFTGYRPDSGHIAELAVETSPVTEGGARLYRAIANITDCLSIPNVSAADLQSGEPNFYFIGSRSYGRAKTFLLQTGLQQLTTILDSLPR